MISNEIVGPEKVTKKEKRKGKKKKREKEKLGRDERPTCSLTHLLFTINPYWII